MSTILRHKPKPKKKRLEPRPLVEAERDACDLVGAVLSLVLNAHASRLGLQEKLRAETHGRDPLAQLRAAIGRGARMDELVNPPPLFWRRRRHAQRGAAAGADGSRERGCGAWR
jgi:hypothetical protein